ncbi:MAG: BBE domain-containing protein [Lysobacter sp.]|nr:BBE domain-containing protein [Lysobacter sp.]
MPLLIWRGASSWPDAAYSAEGRWFFSTYAQWNDAADDEVNRGWLKALYDELATVASGSYINEVDLEERSGGAHRCYSAENWARLRALRKQYDPHGVFHEVSMGDR